MKNTIIGEKISKNDNNIYPAKHYLGFLRCQKTTTTFILPNII